MSYTTGGCPANQLPDVAVLITFAAAARRVGVDPATIWRWALKGVVQPDGARDFLEAWKLPGRWMTTTSAVLSFIQRQTEARRGGPAAPPIRTPAARRRAHEKAERELESMGI